MKLILSGGGIGEKCKVSYEKFAKEVNGGNVLFIPFANDESTTSEALEWFKNEVKPYNINNVEVVNNPTELTKEKLENFKGVYVSGGNAFLLLSILKEYNVFNVLKDYLQTDGVLMGGSAGATVFGRDINACLKDDLKIVASDENYVNLKDTEGFNAVDGYDFFVHYKLKESQFDATEERVQRLLQNGHKLICLPEETSVFVENGKMQIIGEKPAEVITKNFRKIVEVNEYILGEEEYEKV